MIDFWLSCRLAAAAGILASAGSRYCAGVAQTEEDRRRTSLPSGADRFRLTGHADRQHMTAEQPGRARGCPELLSAPFGEQRLKSVTRGQAVPAGLRLSAAVPVNSPSACASQ